MKQMHWVQPPFMKQTHWVQPPFMKQMHCGATGDPSLRSG